MNSVDGLRQNRLLILDSIGSAADSKSGSSDGSPMEPGGAGGFAAVLSHMSDSEAGSDQAALQSNRSVGPAPGLIMRAFAVQAGALGDTGQQNMSSVAGEIGVQDETRHSVAKAGLSVAPASSNTGMTGADSAVQRRSPSEGGESKQLSWSKDLVTAASDANSGIGPAAKKASPKGDTDLGGASSLNVATDSSPSFLAALTYRSEAPSAASTATALQADAHRGADATFGFVSSKNGSAPKVGQVGASALVSERAGGAAKIRGGSAPAASSSGDAVADPLSISAAAWPATSIDGTLSATGPSGLGVAQPGGVRAFKGNSERSADGGSLGTDPVSAPLETALFAAASPSQLAQGNAEPIASPYSAPQGPTARSLAAPISLGVSAVSASDRAGGAGNAPMDVNERAVDRILGSALRAPSDFRASSPSAQSIKATVLGQQTHYPPVAGLSPTQQILDCIAGEPIPGAEAADDAAGPAQTSGAVAATPVTSSVRILDLKLEPDNLGSVTLRLRLAGTQLNLQVEATTPQALRLIDEDKDMLLGKLRASGYSIDALVVKAAQSLTAQGLSASGAAHNASESPTPRVEAPSDPRAQTSGAPQYGEGQSDDHSAPRQDKSRRSGSASDAFPDDRGFGHSNGGDIFI